VNSVLKHNLLAFAGSTIVAATLLLIFSATNGTGELIGASLLLAIPFFVAYVYFRSYIVDAEPLVRYQSIEKIGLGISVVGMMAVSSVYQAHSQTRRAYENPEPNGFAFVWLIAIAIAWLIAWGGYQLARRAVWKQALMTQDVTEKNERQDK